MQRRQTFACSCQLENLIEEKSKHGKNQSVDLNGKEKVDQSNEVGRKNNKSSRKNFQNYMLSPKNVENFHQPNATFRKTEKPYYSQTVAESLGHIQKNSIKKSNYNQKCQIETSIKDSIEKNLYSSKRIDVENIFENLKPKTTSHKSSNRNQPYYIDKSFKSTSKRLHPNCIDLDVITPKESNKERSSISKSNRNSLQHY